jgi:hypothetical protein
MKCFINGMTLKNRTLVEQVFVVKYPNIRPYIEFDANENEILTDAKGLVKFNVYQERKYPYQICCLSQRSVSSYVNDYPSEGEFE